jgi:hypothetical protein
MCELCEAVKNYAKASEDLSFRITQHRHALQMGYATEAEQAQAFAVNALYSVLIQQARIVLLMEKLGIEDTGETPVSFH